MIGKSTPTPPPAPDYAAAATAQGTANQQSALQGAYLSNPNIVSPYGNQTVTWGGDPEHPQATVNQTLTPAAQQTLEAQQRVQLSEANLADQGINKAAGVLGTGFEYNGPKLQTSLPGAGELDYGPRADTYGLAGGIDASAYGQAQNRADTSGIARMPVNAGTTGQQAILQRLNPQIEQTRAATQQRLANQGIPEGSEAWNNEMRQQGQDFNDLYSQAALQGIGLDMSANNQGFGQAMDQAGLYNSALAQNFGQGAAAQQLNNSAIGQNFGQGVTAAGLYNSAQNQKYNQGLQTMGAENAAQQADWQQQLAQYNQPLNQVTALMSGSQIQNPQFQQYTGQNVAAAPVFQGAQAQAQAAQDTYGQQMAARNAQIAALGQVAGMATRFIPGMP